VFAIGKQFKNDEEQIVNTCIKKRITAILLFLVISITYYSLPTTQTTDSLYSILLTETIIKDKKIDIGEHFDTTSNSEIEIPYQIEKINNKENYYFPHGSSFLSAPFVYIINKSGLRSIQDDSYSIDNEIKIQKILSAGLTAATVAVIFLIFKIFLGNTTSLLITTIFAFATPLASTLSRGLWAHTWLALLLSISIFIILRNIHRKSLPNPYILATLMSWMYFVRPISSISIIAISILCLIYFKKIIFKYCATGFLWLLAFTAYSYYNFNLLQPSYYFASRLGTENFFSALVGNLFSPSRGLLIYSCFLLPLLYLAIKNKRIEQYKRVLIIAFFTITSHLIVISSFPHWWGGYSYGPRLMSDMIPWLVVISALSIYNRKELKPSIIITLLTTSILSLLINTWAAYSQKTIEWNGIPDNIDSNPARLWDWKKPQFLAGIQQSPITISFPIIKNDKTIILLNSIAADAFLIDGWSYAESRSRWTEAKTARIGFGLETIQPISISLEFEPFIELDKNTQSIVFYINGERLEEYSFKSPGLEKITLEISDEYLKNQNIITIEIPEATSPASLGISEDKRLLGMAVYQIEINKQNKQ